MNSHHYPMDKFPPRYVSRTNQRAHTKRQRRYNWYLITVALINMYSN